MTSLKKIDRHTVLAQCISVHDQSYLDALINASDAGVGRLISALADEGIRVFVTRNASPFNNCFAATGGKANFIFIDCAKIQLEADYLELSFLDVFAAALCHEAGHVANHLNPVAAPAWDEVSAWGAGFNIYRRFFKQELPASFVTVARACLDSYGIDSYCQEAIDAYKANREVSQALKQRESARRKAWAIAKRAALVAAQAVEAALVAAFARLNAKKPAPAPVKVRPIAAPKPIPAPAPVKVPALIRIAPVFVPALA